MLAEQGEQAAPLVEHFFRYEAGRLTSVLTRIFGWRHFDLVEDMVQATLVDALQAWRIHLPENPSAWVHRCARNRILDALRREKFKQKALEQWANRHTGVEQIDELFCDSGFADSQLRMMFACCHPRLAPEMQIALTLKSLCGFSIPEIGRALLVKDETIKKRLQRATRALADARVTFDLPAALEPGARLESVHRVLYLLFNEGFHATDSDRAVREDLCEEAARLCHLLVSHECTSTPATLALLALMLFHAARLFARLDQGGALLFMEEQDRSRWDQRLIRRAQDFLDQSARGMNVSPYHLEAGIAFYHCSAKSYADTDWRSILRLYDALVAMHGSPVYLLNRAIVLAELEGPRAALAALEEAGSDPLLREYHLYDSARGELYRRAGDLDRARGCFESAYARARSRFDRALIERRIGLCNKVSGK